MKNVFNLIRYPITTEFRAEDLERIPLDILRRWHRKCELYYGSWLGTSGFVSHWFVARNLANITQSKPLRDRERLLGWLKDLIEEYDESI